MKKFLLAILLILTASAVTAQIDPSAELLSRQALSVMASASATEYPDADTLLIDDITRICYETNGTYAYISDMAVKILTEKGRQDESMIQIGYDAAYGTARFVRAEIFKPDGNVTQLDIAAQSREAIDQGQMNANIYDPNSKTIRLTVPDLEIGDVLRYTVSGEQTKTVVPDTWSDIITLEDEYPILHTFYEIDAPAALPLQRIELRDEIPGTVTAGQTQVGDRIHYTWEANNVPQMFPEPDMPEAYTVVQRLLLSTIPDWETLSKWYWNLSKPRLDRINDAMSAKVAELTDGMTDPQKKIEAIFRFVSQEVRYMGITVENEAPGYEPHDVCMTFDNRYGVCRDKAALLTAMLRLAGFDARPVLIYVGPKKDPDVPQPWFNHAITGIRNKDGSWQLMDATNENTRDILPAYLSDRSYLVATPDGETLQTSPVIPPEKNMLSIGIDAALDRDGLINGTATLHFGGINDTAYRGRLARMKADEYEPYFEDRLKQALGSARLLRLEIQPENVRDTSKPLTAILRFEVENSVVEGKKESLLQVPTLINQFGLFGRLIGAGIGLEKRRFPLKVDVTCGVHETVRLDLSKSGLSAAVLPDYETIDTPELTINRSAEKSGAILTATADLLLRTVEFSPAEYLTLKQNLKTSERNARKRVILAPDRIPPDADTVILSDETVYTLFDSYNWQKERVIRKKVLTYAGKKSSADIRVAFNPAFQRVALKSATVTSPDGTVREIDPKKEINIMDADWVADAPRYPAEKILVANLPGVEVGSIIETHFISIFGGQPFFSTVETFGGINPILSKQVRIVMPPSVKMQVDNICPSIIKQRIAHRDDKIIYDWSCENCRTIKKESHLPPSSVAVPSLILSSGEPRSYVVAVNKLLTKAADSKSVKETALSLTKALKSRQEKIVAVRDFVDRTVRSAGPPLTALPTTTVTPAEQTLAEGYGNNTDRAVLLYALLDAAGLKPKFVLTADLPPVPAITAPLIDTFQRGAFDTILVAVENDEKQTVYLGDTDQYAHLGTLAHKNCPGLIMHGGKLDILTTDVRDAGETLFTIDLAENGDAAVGMQHTFYGTDYEYFHQKYAQFTPEERRRNYQGLLAGISQSAEAAGPLKTSFDHPGKLEFSASVPGYAIRTDDCIYFTLPAGLGNILGIDSDTRENAFYIARPVNQTIAYKIKIPDGWDIALMPEPFKETLPNGGGTIETETAFAEGRLVIIQRIALNPTLIPALKYDTLLKINERLTRPAASTLLLRKQAIHPAK